MSGVTSALTKVAGKSILRLQKHAPAILTISGVVGLTTAGVMAAKATLGAEEIIESLKDDLFLVKEAEEKKNLPKEEVTKLRVAAYSVNAKAWIKLYGPAVSLGAVSIVSILVGHKILHQRNLAAVAAYKAVEETFTKYRSRVVEEFGAERDTDILREVTLDKIREASASTKEDEKPKEPQEGTFFARIFDRENKNWQGAEGYNQAFLLSQQNFANHRLQTDGFLTLNDVYDSLGIPRTSAGMITGWVLNSIEGDNYVDFRIQDLSSVEGFEDDRNAFFLDFNVDGIIYDLVDKKTRD